MMSKRTVAVSITSGIVLLGFVIAVVLAALGLKTLATVVAIVTIAAVFTLWWFSTAGIALVVLVIWRYFKTPPHEHNVRPSTRKLVWMAIGWPITLVVLVARVLFYSTRSEHQKLTP